MAELVEAFLEAGVVDRDACLRRILEAAQDEAQLPLLFPAESGHAFAFVRAAAKGLADKLEAALAARSPPAALAQLASLDSSARLIALVTRLTADADAAGGVVSARVPALLARALAALGGAEPADLLSTLLCNVVRPPETGAALQLLSAGLLAPLWREGAAPGLRALHELLASRLDAATATALAADGLIGAALELVCSRGRCLQPAVLVLVTALRASAGTDHSFLPLFAAAHGYDRVRDACVAAAEAEDDTLPMLLDCVAELVLIADSPLDADEVAGSVSVHEFAAEMADGGGGASCRPAAASSKNPKPVKPSPADDSLRAVNVAAYDVLPQVLHALVETGTATATATDISPARETAQLAVLRHMTAICTAHPRNHRLLTANHPLVPVIERFDALPSSVRRVTGEALRALAAEADDVGVLPFAELCALSCLLQDPLQDATMADIVRALEALVEAHSGYQAVLPKTGVVDMLSGLLQVRAGAEVRDGSQRGAVLHAATLPLVVGCLQALVRRCPPNAATVHAAGGLKAAAALLAAPDAASRAADLWAETAREAAHGGLSAVVDDALRWVFATLRRGDPHAVAGATRALRTLLRPATAGTPLLQERFRELRGADELLAALRRTAETADDPSFCLRAAAAVLRLLGHAVAANPAARAHVRERRREYGAAALAAARRALELDEAAAAPRLEQVFVALVALAVEGHPADLDCRGRPPDLRNPEAVVVMLRVLRAVEAFAAAREVQVAERVLHFLTWLLTRSLGNWHRATRADSRVLEALLRLFAHRGAPLLDASHELHEPLSRLLVRLARYRVAGPALRSWARLVALHPRGGPLFAPFVAAARGGVCSAAEAKETSAEERGGAGAGAGGAGAGAGAGDVPSFSLRLDRTGHSSLFMPALSLPPTPGEDVGVPQPQWPPPNGYAFAAWVRLDAMETAQPSEQYAAMCARKQCIMCGQPWTNAHEIKCGHAGCESCLRERLTGMFPFVEQGSHCAICFPPPLFLFRLRSADSRSIAEAFVAEGGVVHVRTASANGRPHEAAFDSFLLRPRRWQHVAISHQHNRLQSSHVTLYVNGIPVGTERLAYPASAPASAVGLHIGTPPAFRRPSAQTWSLGPAYLLEDVLPAPAACALFAAGPAYDSCFHGENGHGVVPATLELLSPANVAILRDAGLLAPEDDARDVPSVYALTLPLAAAQVVAAVSARGLQSPSSGGGGDGPPRVANGAGRAFAFPYLQRLGSVDPLLPTRIADSLRELCDGGVPAALLLLDRARSAAEVAGAAAVLAAALRAHPHNLRAMDRLHGYHVLVHIVGAQAKRGSLGADAARALLSIVGVWEAGDQTEGRALLNLRAAEALLLDFGVWRLAAPDVQRLVVQTLHAAVVSGTTAQREFNRQALRSLSAVQRLLYALTDAALEPFFADVLGIVAVLLTEDQPLRSDFQAVAAFVLTTLSPQFNRADAAAGPRTQAELRHQAAIRNALLGMLLDRIAQPLAARPGQHGSLALLCATHFLDHDPRDVAFSQPSSASHPGLLRSAASVASASSTPRRRAGSAMSGFESSTTTRRRVQRVPPDPASVALVLRLLNVLVRVPAYHDSFVRQQPFRDLTATLPGCYRAALAAGGSAGGDILYLVTSLLLGLPATGAPEELRFDVYNLSMDFQLNNDRLQFPAALHTLLALLRHSALRNRALAPLPESPQRRARTGTWSSRARVRSARAGSGNSSLALDDDIAARARAAIAASAASASASEEIDAEVAAAVAAGSLAGGDEEDDDDGEEVVPAVWEQPDGLLLPGAPAARLEATLGMAAVQFLVHLHSGHAQFRELCRGDRVIEDLVATLFAVVRAQTLVELSSVPAAGSDSGGSSRSTSRAGSWSASGSGSEVEDDADPEDAEEPAAEQPPDDDQQSAAAGEFDADAGGLRDPFCVPTVALLLDLVANVVCDHLRSSRGLVALETALDAAPEPEPPMTPGYVAHFQGLLLVRVLGVVEGDLRAKPELLSASSRLGANVGRLAGFVVDRMRLWHRGADQPPPPPFLLAVRQHVFAAGPERLLRFLLLLLRLAPGLVRRPPRKRGGLMQLQLGLSRGKESDSLATALFDALNATVLHLLHSKRDLVRVMTTLCKYSDALLGARNGDREFVVCFCYLATEMIFDANETVRDAGLALWQLALKEQPELCADVIVDGAEDGQLSRRALGAVVADIGDTDSPEFRAWLDTYSPTLKALARRLGRVWEQRHRVAFAAVGDLGAALDRRWRAAALKAARRERRALVSTARALDRRVKALLSSQEGELRRQVHWAQARSDAGKFAARAWAEMRGNLAREGGVAGRLSLPADEEDGDSGADDSSDEDGLPALPAGSVVTAAAGDWRVDETEDAARMRRKLGRTRWGTQFMVDGRCVRELVAAEGTARADLDSSMGYTPPASVLRKAPSDAWLVATPAAVARPSPESPESPVDDDDVVDDDVAVMADVESDADSDAAGAELEGEGEGEGEEPGGEEGEDDVELTLLVEPVDPVQQKLQPLLLPGDEIETVYNCSLVTGMDSCAAVLLVCKRNLYLVQHYQVLEGRVVEAFQDAAAAAAAVAPTTPTAAATTPDEPQGGGEDDEGHKCRQWAYDELEQLHKRRYLLRHVALELFAADGRSHLIVVAAKQTREEVFHALMARSSALSGGLAAGPGSGAGGDLYSAVRRRWVKSITARWQQREISNFDYLMHLNTLAGRSYNDLTQYPVFPWILSDYESPTLDLEDPASFRDLSRPMGALHREEEFRARFDALGPPQQDGPPGPDSPFHYGTHYSSAAIVLHYLIRLQPFTDKLVALQGGRLDHPDRLFCSIQRAWLASAGLADQQQTQDVRELVPEMFYLPEALENKNDYNLGVGQDGDVVGSVRLPPWARGSAREFVRLHRQALESEHVSANLHHWIDLIFGHKQQGREAAEACNVFYFLTYEGAVDLDEIDDPDLRNAYQSQIHEFGQTPSQLFKSPHPPRNSAAWLRNSASASAAPDLKFHEAPGAVVPSSGRTVTAAAGEGGVGLLRQVGDRVLALPRRCALLDAHEFVSWGFGDCSWRVRSVGAAEGGTGESKVVSSHDLYPAGAAAAAVAVTADGGTVVSSARGWPVVFVWRHRPRRARRFALEATLTSPLHRGSVVHLAVSQDHSLLVSACEGNVVLLWDLNRRRFVRELLPGERAGAGAGPVGALAVDPRTGNILLGLGAVLLVCTVNGDPLAVVDADVPDDDDDDAAADLPGAIRSLTLSAAPEWSEDNVFVTGHDDGTIIVWRFDFRVAHVRRASSLMLSPPRGAGGSPGSGSFSDSDSSDDGLLHEPSGLPGADDSCWDFAQLARLRGHNGAVTALHVSPDQRRLYSGDAGGAVVCWTFPVADGR